MFEPLQRGIPRMNDGLQMNGRLPILERLVTKISEWGGHTWSGMASPIGQYAHAVPALLEYAPEALLALA